MSFRNHRFRFHACAAVVAMAAVWTTTNQAQAGKNTELKPVLAKPGKVLFEADFADELGDKWTSAKGEWKVAGGVVSGREKPEDMHAAVLVLGAANRNSLVRCSFKMQGAKAVHLSFNHAQGHLFRVVVTPRGVILRTDKDKKDPKSVSQVLAEAGAEFKDGEWYTLLVEVQGDQVAVQTDNGVALKGRHASLDVDKPNYRFILSGGQVSLDDLKIWSAE